MERPAIRKHQFENSNDGKIGRRIIANRPSRSAPSVRQRHFDPCRVVHDVAIGEDQSIGREDEAGAASTALAGLTRTSSAASLMYFNVHYRRTDSLNRGGDRQRGRVEQASVNMPEFGKAFGCKVGQPMTPAKACRVW
ncbi:MAG: hypothetical protein ABR861_13270 [Terriglobales bacterium]